MRKTLSSLAVLGLTLVTATAFAQKNYRMLPTTTSGSPIKLSGKAQFDPHSPLKAQNRLSSTMNAFLIKEKSGASYRNGTVNTIPYFDSWFITGGGHNSIYTYSIVGHSPKTGGTTTVNNQIIPLITALSFRGQIIYTFDPTANTDGDTDVNLLAQSPLYNASTTYPGPPADTGQMLDTLQRAQYNGVRAANWHTVLAPPSSSGIVWIQTLIWENGDWACEAGETPSPTCAASFPVFNINTISNNFSTILSAEMPANNTVPIIVTDWLTAFDPAGGCCILGYHTAQAGIQDPSGILVWTWGTYIPHNADNGMTNPFGAFGNDIMVLSHELGELFDDPFVNTAVSPWVDGSVSFAQGNLENGDTIEAMSAADVVYPVTLNTSVGPYTYNEQNLSTLAWFTRNPLSGALYSWPNEHTLSQFAHPAGCTAAFSCSWIYGEGSAAFYFGPPY